MERTVTNLLILAFLVEVLLAIVWAYPEIRRVYKQENGSSSPLFRALFIMDTIAVVVLLCFVPPSLDALGFFELHLPFVGAGITLGVMLLAGGVIAHRIAFDRVRARGRHVSESAPEAEGEST